ncbi:MBL fold metallo-hydrolase [Candidatus Thorarchaeota archaeon]|nr:MAG: MBL fold metallo-hydrolase [Candidatus Thorarchaeota archaeon]
MLVQRIGSRGMVISFEEPYLTNIYLIVTDERLFVLDTFLGSSPMNQLREVIDKEGLSGRPIVIFNSHADYDHYWGNGSLPSTMIIGHIKCRERIISECSKAIERYSDHKRGDVIIGPPNITFTNKLFFPNDGIEFFYSPGHTLDSASCYDSVDGVLFVGDNIEDPIPYLNHANFEQYVKTLRKYLEIDWKTMVTGHDKILKSSDLIYHNLKYLSAFLNWDFDLESMEDAEFKRHLRHNLVTLKDELMRDNSSGDFIRHLNDVNQRELDL